MLYTHIFFCSICIRYRYRLSIVVLQGTNHIRPMRKPIELPFHLDARMHAGIQDAVKQFNQNVRSDSLYQ